MNSTQAKQRLEDYTAEVAQASAEVDDTRDALAEGEASPGDVTKAQRALAKAQERQENARAALRVAERREAVEKAHIQAESDRIGRELKAIAQQKAAKEIEAYRAFLLATAADAEGYNQRLTAYEHRLGYGSMNVPGRFKSFGLLGRAIQDQVFRFPATNSHSQEA